MLARKADYLKALAREIRQGGSTVLDLSCDVSDHAQIAYAFRAVREELGEPDVLLYNAGSGTFGAITEITPISTKQTGGNAGTLRSQGNCARDDCARRRRCSSRGDHQREGRAEVGLARTREVPQSQIEQSLARDLRSERHPRRFDQRGWQHRHP